MNKCPGQDNRPVTAECRPCTQCGASIEFFSDEMVRYCPSCHSRQVKEADPLCAAWCPAAGECLGDPAKARMIKARMLAETKPEDMERIRQLMERVRIKCQK